MPFLHIRGETVQHSSTKKKLEVSRDSELLSDIEKLKNEEDRADNQNKIKKQYELLEIREKKMKSHYVSLFIYLGFNIAFNIVQAI